MKTKTEHGDAPDLFTRNDLDLSLMNCEDLWLRLAKKKKKWLYFECKYECGN